LQSSYLSAQKGAFEFVIGPQFAASSLFWNQAYHCGGAMGIFDDKNASDKTKADFSDVTSGASTSSPTPATTGGQSYTVKSISTVMPISGTGFTTPTRTRSRIPTSFIRARSSRSRRREHRQQKEISDVPNEDCGRGSRGDSGRSERLQKERCNYDG
jgi:hypothetical protein